MTKADCMKIYNNKCCKCGIILKVDEHAHFHHLDSNSKTMTISRIVKQYGKEKVMTELKKTVLICDECHRDLHRTLGKNVTKRQSLDYIKGVI